MPGLSRSGEKLNIDLKKIPDGKNVHHSIRNQSNETFHHDAVQRNTTISEKKRTLQNYSSGKVRTTNYTSAISLQVVMEKDARKLHQT